MKPTIAPTPAPEARYFQNFPETPEGVGLALLQLILDQDRSLTSRTAAQPVAAYILDLYAECFAAVSGQRVRREMQ
jgi:hypothetical protein